MHHTAWYRITWTYCKHTGHHPGLGSMAVTGTDYHSWDCVHLYCKDSFCKCMQNFMVDDCLTVQWKLFSLLILNWISYNKHIIEIIQQGYIYTLYQYTLYKLFISPSAYPLQLTAMWSASSGRCIVRHWHPLSLAVPYLCLLLWGSSCWLWP